MLLKDRYTSKIYRVIREVSDTTVYVEDEDEDKKFSSKKHLISAHFNRVSINTFYTKPISNLAFIGIKRKYTESDCCNICSGFGGFNTFYSHVDNCGIEYNRCYECAGHGIRVKWSDIHGVMKYNYLTQNYEVWKNCPLKSLLLH